VNAITKKFNALLKHYQALKNDAISYGTMYEAHRLDGVIDGIMATGTIIDDLFVESEEGINEENIALDKETKHLQDSNGWISTKDKMPPRGKSVELGCLARGARTVGWLNDHSLENYWKFCSPNQDDTTHWRILKD
jgi:hypothetical protein